METSHIMVMDSSVVIATLLATALALFIGAVSLVIFRMSLAYRQQFAEERALERSMEKHMLVAARREQKRQQIRAQRRAARLQARPPARPSMAHA